ncbi:MAG: Hrp-dependent type III effector protein [Firmicutes bacterium HGW-Firmicutes-5]|nr:MAG: Hrp-dependent type III effector protein [Firmicutes bacterium HGW-Firmicutes-5]
MLMLLIIADDFTGALDTGVQFSTYGAVTRVVTNNTYDFENMDKDVQVLVIDAETRHLKAKDAYDVTYGIVTRALKAEIPYIYKKTDSALRGNIGSELTGMLNASGEQVLHFIPALPSMNRTTQNGIHYIDGVPVCESVFGQDPFEPVLCSYIPEIIKQQSNVSVSIVEQGQVMDRLNEPVIAVYDAKTNERLKEIAKSLKEKGQMRLMAGCAGFATVLSEMLDLKGPVNKKPEFKANFLVINGSVNPITKKQLKYAQMHDFYRIRMTPEQKLEDQYLETIKGIEVMESWKHLCQTNRKCILDTNDLLVDKETLAYAKTQELTLEEVRQKIASNLGGILKKLMDMGVDSTMLLIGGDTLLGFMEHIKVYEITPVMELAQGTVLSRFKYLNKEYELISKSGGFGHKELLAELADLVLKVNKEELIC